MRTEPAQRAGQAVPGTRDAPAEDDALIIERSRADPAVFAELFRRHAGRIQRYVVRRLGPDDADDIVADTFLAAFTRRDRYDPGCRDALPWLFGIASNLIGRHRRKELSHYRLLARTGIDPVLAPFTDEVDAAVSASAAKRQLAAALARLPADQREALLLIVWSELSYEQAASALGVPAGTVRSRVSRARARLRRALESAGITISGPEELL